MINALKLNKELDAKIVEMHYTFTVVTVHSTNGVTYSRSLSGVEQAVMDAVIYQHDPTDYQITPAEVMILSDGIDTAVFTITGNPESLSDTVSISGSIVTIPLTLGVGHVNVTSDIPGIILVEYRGNKSKVYAGEVL